MKKLILSFLTIFGLTTTALAATPGVFAVSATIPAATDVTFVTSKVTNGPPITFVPHATGSGAALTWAASDLTFLPGTQADPINIWVGKYFFAIDLSPSIGVGGAAASGNYGSVTFSYTGETVPAGQPAGEGLGKRAILTAVKVVGTNETTLRGPARLAAVGTLTGITGAEVSGGFLRCYVGLYTGSPAVAGAVPPTNGDKPGAYGGTLTITATLV